MHWPHRTSSCAYSPRPRKVCVSKLWTSLQKCLLAVHFTGSDVKLQPPRHGSRVCCHCVHPHDVGCLLPALLTSLSRSDGAVFQPGSLRGRRWLVGAQVCVCSLPFVCVCVCARRPADCGTSAECCLPFPQSFDVTRSRCDNERCALLQGEHPAVRLRRCQSGGPTPSHTSTAHAVEGLTSGLR